MYVNIFHDSERTFANTYSKSALSEESGKDRSSIDSRIKHRSQISNPLEWRQQVNLCIMQRIIRSAYLDAYLPVTGHTQVATCAEMALAIR